MIINGKKIKAKDLAKLAEVSRSTVIKYYGISREDYLKEASKKRSLSFQLTFYLYPFLPPIVIIPNF